MRRTFRSSRTLSLHGNLTNTKLPDFLVELWVDSHILDTHCLLCKLGHFLDGLWCTLLEGCVVYSLVQVDGILALWE